MDMIKEELKLQYQSKPIERKNAVIVGVQIFFLVVSLFLMIYIGQTDSPKTTYNLYPSMFSGFVARPVAIFLGTLLLLKGLRVFYTNDVRADRYIKFRVSMHFASWVFIAFYILFLLGAFGELTGFRFLQPLFNPKTADFMMKNTTVLSALTAVLFRLKNL